MAGPKSIGGEPPRVSRRYALRLIADSAKAAAGSILLSHCGRTGLEVGPYDRLPCNGIEKIPIDGSPQKIAAAAMKFKDGEVVLETTFKIPNEGTIFIDPLRGSGSTLELLLGINNGRLVTDEAGRMADSEGRIRIQPEPGEACEAVLSSCAPYKGLGPKIVPVGLVRKTFDGKTLLKQEIGNEFVAVGRMTDAYFGQPVFKFKDVGGIERLAVRIAVNDPTLSCTQTFYFELNRDGKFLDRHNNVIENPEELLPILRFDEATGNCVVDDPGGLSDLNLLVSEVGEEALRITYFYYRYDPIAEEYKDKDEVGNPIPLPASERAWEKEYEVLADPNKGLNDIGDLSQLQTLAVDPGEVALIIEGEGVEPQRATINLLDMEQENSGPGFVIDPGFYQSDDFAVKVTLRSKLVIEGNPELQPELVYTAGVEGLLSLRCE